MANPRKPVKVLTDLLTRKQIIKQDESGNIVFNVSGALGDGFVSSSLPLSASEAFLVKALVSSLGPFSNIPVTTSSLDSYSIYDVDEAFHAIDTALATANGPDIQNAYTRLRYVEVGAFDPDGSKVIVLPVTGAMPSEMRFPAYSLDYLNVQVSVKSSGSNSWMNDLVSVETTVSGAGNDQIWIIIDAPALSSADSYKLIAVNENPSDYVVY